MAKYKAPKVRLHRDFFYLNDVVSINSLSALESGKVDELAVRHSGGQVRSDIESAQVRVLRARCSLHGYPTDRISAGVSRQARRPPECRWMSSAMG